LNIFLSELNCLMNCHVIGTEKHTASIFKIEMEEEGLFETLICNCPHNYQQSHGYNHRGRNVQRHLLQVKKNMIHNIGAKKKYDCK
jgi:hypothetical protein